MCRAVLMALQPLMDRPEMQPPVPLNPLNRRRNVSYERIIARYKIGEQKKEDIDHAIEHSSWSKTNINW